MDSEFKSFLRGNKRILIIGAALILGILLIVFSSSGASEKKVDGESGAEMTLEEYKAELEERIGSLCSSVEGVGKCRVFITFSSGEEKVYKGSAVIETKPPTVLGVTVVCRGADSDSVRYALIDMLSALFDIGTNRIAILKLNS